MRGKLILGGLAATQIAVSVLTQVIVLALLGPGRDTDAFIAAQTIPMVLVSIAGASLQSAWQPRLARASEIDRTTLTRKVFSQSLFLSVLMAVGALALVPVLSRYVFIGFDRETRALFEFLSYITVLAIPFNVLLSSFVPVFRARGRFLSSEAIPAVIFLISLAALPFLVGRFGVAGAAFTVLGRAALSAAVMWAFAGAPVPALGWRSTSNDIGPLLAGSSLYKTGPIVDRYWASQSPAGEMTLFALVQTGLTAAAAVVERTIGGPAQPRFSVLWASEDFVGFRRAVWRALLQSGAVLLTCTGMFFAGQGLLPWLLSLAIGLDAVESGRVVAFGWTLLGFFWVAAAGGVPVAAFYATGDVRTPVVVGALGFLAGVALKVFGYTHFGLMGVGLSTSIYYVANFVITGILLERRIRRAEGAGRRL